MGKDNNETMEFPGRRFLRKFPVNSLDQSFICNTMKCLHPVKEGIESKKRYIGISKIPPD